MRYGDGDEKLTWAVYGAYLVARATGRPPGARKDGAFPTLGEQYAVALGVHHYFAGREPISCAGLHQRIDEDCEVPERFRGVPEGETPETRSPGGFALAARLDHLRDFLSWSFPDEEGGSEVCVAVRLLGELKNARDLVDQTINLARNAAENERKACAKWLREAGTGALARQIEAGRHLGPTPPDPGEKVELPGPWRVLPENIAILDAAKESSIVVSSGRVTQDPTPPVDVYLNSTFVAVARGMTREGVAFIDSILKKHP